MTPMNKKVKEIFSKSWENITRTDLEYIYLELDYLKSHIATQFGVNKSQVSYKLKKLGINKQSYLLKKSLEQATKTAGNQSLERHIFSRFDILTDSDDSLYFGPVKVIKGEHKGRIGLYDDEDGNYGYVYWGNMVGTIDACSTIKLSYLSNNITTYDLFNRVEKLGNQISQQRAKKSLGETYFGDNTLVELYGEYIFALNLLNNIYISTNYLQGEGTKKVFISHSSANKDIALFIASDLKQAKYNVWFDKWDIKLGHSIPQSISDGLDSADALLILLSNDYLNSAFCRDEWQGFYMKFNTQNKPIITIVIDDSEPPTILSSRKYYRMNDWNDYNNMLDELKLSLSDI